MLERDSWNKYINNTLKDTGEKEVGFKAETD